MIIKEIPNQFKANGYCYNLIKRVGEFALYSQKSNFCCNAIAYEVHKIRIYPISKFKGINQGDINRYTHYEKLASNSEFGKFGWSYATLEAVRQVWPVFFNEVVAAK